MNRKEFPKFPVCDEILKPGAAPFQLLSLKQDTLLERIDCIILGNLVHIQRLKLGEPQKGGFTLLKREGLRGEGSMFPRFPTKFSLCSLVP